MYVRNPQNDDYGDLPLDCDQKLITRWRIYCINNDIIEMFTNCFIDDVYTNQM